MRSNHIGSDVRFCMWTSRKTFVRSSADNNAEGERGTWTFVLTDNGLVTYTKRNSEPLSSANGHCVHTYGWSRRGKGDIGFKGGQGNAQQICKTCERFATRYHPPYPRQSHRRSLLRLHWQVSARQVGAGTRRCKPVRAGRVP